MLLKARFAELNIGMECRFPEMERFCRDYLVSEDQEVAFTVSPSMEEILAEGKKELLGHYSSGYLETLAVQRQISERLPFYHRFLMHGAVISYRGTGYMFTALSGTGKSTHIRLWRQFLGEEVQVVNGDKPFLHIEEQVLVYGTPWAGKEGWNSNMGVPLDGICFLCRGKENRIRKITPLESLERFMMQIYMPESAETAGLTLELMDQLLQMVPLYLMECDISEDAVKMSFEAMTKMRYEECKS